MPFRGTPPRRHGPARPPTILRRRVAAGVALGLSAVPAGLRAQDSLPPPPYVVILPASVRSVGMSGVGAALVGDAGAVFSNPAGLATIHHISLEGAYRPAADGARLFSGALGWRLSQFDLGVGGRYFDMGTDPSQYVGSEAPAGSNTREALGVASLVYRYGLIAFGVSGRYASRSIDSAKVRGVSGDAGLTVAFFDIMALGFSVQNIGGNWRQSSTLAMPRLTRLGFTMNYVDPQESFRLLSTVEVQWPEGYAARFVVGVEAGVVIEGVGVVGRVGYGGDSPGLPNSQVSFGGTLNIGVLKVDYAYRHRDLLDEQAHHVGLRFTL